METLTVGWNAGVFFIFVTSMTNFLLKNIFVRLKLTFLSLKTDSSQSKACLHGAQVAVIVGNFEMNEEEKKRKQILQYQKNQRLLGAHTTGATGLD